MFWFWFILFTVALWFMTNQKKQVEGPPADVKPAQPIWARVVAMILISPITALFAVFITSCTGGSGGSSGGSNSGSFSQSEALMICQYSIKGSMMDASSTDVPYVDDQGSGNEYYFAWGSSTKSIRTRNGLGLEVPASASCIVDKRSKSITQLTVNGKTIK